VSKIDRDFIICEPHSLKPRAERRRG
jgi:hypothetical protein